MTCPRQIARVRHFITRCYEDESLGIPRPTYLPVLIRLNVLNAVAFNAKLMGFPPEGLCDDDFISPYSEKRPRLPSLRMPAASCPNVLTPTTVQREIPHHPWIDLFPFPRLRNNVLYAVHAGVFHEDELCTETLSVEAGDLRDKPTLIVWGESWDFRGLEANISFF